MIFTTGKHIFMLKSAENRGGAMLSEPPFPPLGPTADLSNHGYFSSQITVARMAGFQHQASFSQVVIRRIDDSLG